MRPSLWLETFLLLKGTVLIVNGSLVTHDASLSKGSVPTIDFFKVIENSAASINGAAHSVAGIATSDGGFVASGTFGSATSENQDGFAVKVDSAGKYVWTYTFKGAGTTDSQLYESALSIVEGPSSDNHALYLAGISWGTADNYDRTLIKLTKDGQEVWKAMFPDPTSKYNGGWEMISLDDETGDAVLSGFVDGAPEWVPGEFKSGGNPESCEANIARITAAALQRSTAPTTADFTYDLKFTDPDFMSFTSVRTLTKGEAIVTSRIRKEVPTHVDESGLTEPPQVIRLNADGSIKWHIELPEIGEATDVAVAPDASFYIIAGHGCGTAAGRVACFSRVEADGTKSWTTQHGNTNKYIFDECWGITMVSDSKGIGAVSACGMGIEPGYCPSDQSKWGDEEKYACVGTEQGGFGSVWRCHTIRVAATDGSLVWSTVDSYGGENSAVEWISSIPAKGGGGYIVFTDNDSGMGFIKISEAESTSAPSPTSSPTPSSASSPSPSPSPGSTPAPSPTSSPTPSPASSSTVSLAQTWCGSCLMFLSLAAFYF